MRLKQDQRLQTAQQARDAIKALCERPAGVFEKMDTNQKLEATTSAKACVSDEADAEVCSCDEVEADAEVCSSDEMEADVGITRRETLKPNPSSSFDIILPAPAISPDTKASVALHSVVEACERDKQVPDMDMERERERERSSASWTSTNSNSSSLPPNFH